MRVFGLVVVIFTGVILAYASKDFPQWGDPNAPAHGVIQEHYITQTTEETTVPNIVTAVLADYRGYDTMLETVVVFCAGIAIVLLLRMPSHLRKWGRSRTMIRERMRSVTSKRHHILPVQNDVIVTTASRMIFPIAQLFALYVLAHGHHSPGGGFQGGVILGASFILIAVSYNLQTALSRMSPKLHIVQAAIGVVIYAAIGFACLLLGGNFLDYSILSTVLPVSGPEARSLAIFGVEVGVAFTVMAVMISMYVDLASRGRLSRGL